MKRSLFHRVFVLILAGVSSALFPNPANATTNPVPYLNPLQPDSATPGGAAFPLTVTGTGFVSTSVVNWNGSQRTTTFVNSSQLTAAITAADIANPTTATITVVSPPFAAGGKDGGASNSQYFQVAYSLSQLSWTSFSLSGNVPTTSRVVGGDFNNDGKLDWAVAMGSRVFVIPGNGDGTFGTAIPSFGPSGTISGIYAADENGDGKLDLIVTGSLSTSKSFIATMIGNGDGTFQAPIETDFNGTIPTTGVLADFNGDGALDFAYATASGVQTLLGKADGSFTFLSGPSSPLSQIGLAAVAAGDFNGDGKLDVVVTVYDPFTTGLDFPGVMNGNGDGSFAALVPVNGSGAAYVGSITAVAGDFDHDGKLDVATAIQTAGATLQGIIQVSSGNGDGTFKAPYTVPNVPQVTTPLLVADFNGDGNLDLSTGGFIYYGLGNGTFPTSSGRTGLPTFVLAGDAKGDGQEDIFTDAITFSGSTVYHSFGLELQIPPTPDFKGIVAPFASTLVPGGSLSFNVTAEALYGFTGDIIVGVSGVPNGITPSYNPVVIKGGSGTSTITIAAANNMPLGHYTATLTGSSGSLFHSTTVPFDVNDSVGDWTGYVVQQSQNIAPGGKAYYELSTKGVNGFNGNISLNVSGLPPGATASFNPPMISGGTGSSVLTVTTAGTTPQPQIYNLTVTGTNGILVHSTSVYLGVSSTGGDFTGSVSPSQGSVSASAQVSSAFTVSATPINGGAGDLTLTASGMPAGLSASFSSTTIPGSSGSSTLTLKASSGTPTGTYQIFINASGSGAFHQSSVMLTVTQ
jgi:hypothetical protein